MPIQSINNSNPSVKTQTFKSTTPVENPYQEEKSNSTKYWVLGGLAALAAVGTYFVFKNRANKTPVAEAKEVVSEVKQMSFKEFKEAGNKFESGKAKLTNGDLFSGIIKKGNADKSVLTLEYKNGILQKSSKVKDGATVFNKTYTHNASGNLRTVFNKDGKSLEIKVENDIKTIKTTKNNSIKFDIDKKKVLSYQKNGEQKKEYFYRNNDKNTLKYIKENDKITKFAEDGKTEVFTATEAEAQDISELCKNLGDKFDFSELKNIGAFLTDKWKRARGTIVGGTPVSAPKIKLPKGADYVDTMKKIKDKLIIKNAFEETKNGHYI